MCNWRPKSNFQVVCWGMTCEYSLGNDFHVELGVRNILFSWNKSLLTLHIWHPLTQTSALFQKKKNAFEKYIFGWDLYLNNAAFGHNWYALLCISHEQEYLPQHLLAKIANVLQRFLESSIWNACIQALATPHSTTWHNLYSKFSFNPTCMQETANLKPTIEIFHLFIFILANQTREIKTNQEKTRKRKLTQSSNGDWKQMSLVFSWFLIQLVFHIFDWCLLYYLRKN